ELLGDLVSRSIASFSCQVEKRGHPTPWPDSSIIRTTADEGSRPSAARYSRAISALLRAIVRRETSDAVQAGNLLIKARKLFANEHGEWLPWLAENFDLSPRTAQRYIAAAEHVQKRQVSLFANPSTTVLYGLAEGHYNEQEEAEILAQAIAGKRIDQDQAWAICPAGPPPASNLASPHFALLGSDRRTEAAHDQVVCAICQHQPQHRSTRERRTLHSCCGPKAGVASRSHN